MRSSLVALVLVLSPVSLAHANERYVGYVGGGERAYHRASQGGLFHLVFTDADFSARRYRVCSEGTNQPRRCVTRKLRLGFSKVNANSTDLITFAGRYVIRWYVDGRQVAAWRFRLLRESEG